MVGLETTQSCMSDSLQTKTTSSRSASCTGATATRTKCKSARNFRQIWEKYFTILVAIRKRLRIVRADERGPVSRAKKDKMTKFSETIPAGGAGTTERQTSDGGA